MQSVEQLTRQAVELAQSGHVSAAAQMLRERLVRDPRNVALREALADVYRTGGHPEQGARYVFALEPYDAQAAEPYLRWLASTGADESRLRHLSALPENEPIPQPALDRLEQLRAAPTVHQPWETLSFIGVIAALSLALITLLAVYVAVLIDGELGRVLALLGGAVTAAALAAGMVGIAGSNWRSGAPRSAAIAASLSVVAVTVCVIATIVLVNEVAP